MQNTCSSSSQLTRVPGEFGIFGYLARTPLSIVTPDTCIHSTYKDYNYTAHRLPLPPLFPVGLFRAVVAAGATATGVLADTTGATGAALTTGATEAALLTTGATGAELTAAALVATDETAGTAEVTAGAVGTTGEVETTAEPAAAVVPCSAPTVPTGGGTCDEATPVETPVTSQA
jgi:hypothetical protein